MLEAGAHFAVTNPRAAVLSGLKRVRRGTGIPYEFTIKQESEYLTTHNSELATRPPYGGGSSVFSC
jgi:hypothetical protein